MEEEKRWKRPVITFFSSAWNRNKKLQTGHKESLVLVSLPKLIFSSFLSEKLLLLFPAAAAAEVGRAAARAGWRALAGGAQAEQQKRKKGLRFLSREFEV